MHALLFYILFVVTLVNVSCDVIHDDDGGDGDCHESPWLCRQLVEMQRVMAEQQRVNQQQSSMIVQQNKQIDEQSSVIVDLSSRVDQQSSMIAHQNKQIHEQSSVIVDLSSMVIQLQTKDSKQDTLIQKLQEELVILKTEKQNETNGVDSISGHETSLTSNQRDVASRSDDGGPLEAVVNQISQQLTTVSADVQVLKNTDQVLQNVNHQQDLNIQDARTSTFVHWGSSHCPSDAQLVYSGVVGGSGYQHTGGGINYLCLTMSPVLSSHAIPHIEAYLYGTEYETNDAHQDMDPVCAVCRSSHSTTIMIPGTNVCTPGWTKQYDGFLMAQNYVNVGSSEFVCVDSAMESRPGTGANLNGRGFFFTLTQCGSLPCGPYVNNKIVTCVVCSM